MPTVDLKNESEYSFTDISSEKYRNYQFDGVDVTIENPEWLAVSDNGHRILDASGVSHYIGFDGFYFNWQSEQGAPHFVA